MLFRSEARFRAIEREFLDFCGRIGIPDPVVVPISALGGDNVVARSAHTPWYSGSPVLGLVYAPAIGRLFGGAQGAGAWLEDEHGRRSIACRPVPAEGLTVVASRSHGDETALDAFLAGRKVASRTNAGSSLKLCLVAAGEADLYPRLGRTMEWDIAAGDAVLRAAGGKVTVVADGQLLRYGKPGFDNPHFAAAGL